MKELTHNDLMETRPRGAPLSFRIWRGLRKIWHAALPASMPRRFVRGGIHYASDGADDDMVGILAKQGFHERWQVLYLFNEARRRGCDIFLDIGANFGYYALTATKTGDFAEIHAVEAHPKTYRRLADNIRLNRLQSVVKSHNIAADSKEGEMFIDDQASSTATVAADKREGAAVKIQSAPLDSIFNFSGRSIAVKMDVEEHEVAALEGMKNLLARNSVLLQVEVLPENSESALHYLFGNNFRCIHRINSDFYFVHDRGTAA